MLYLLFLLCCFSCAANTIKQTATYLVEEIYNGTSFKHVTELDNGSTREIFFINGKSVPDSEYENALLNAQKEENRKLRKKTQEERLKVYETQYKGRVKVAQTDLKEALGMLEEEIKRLADERLKPFMLYKSDTLESADYLVSIKEKLVPEARTYLQTNPEKIDLKKIHDTEQEIQNLLPRIRETFVTAVNNAIEKADDTKLLKELLTLL